MNYYKTDILPSSARRGAHRRDTIIKASVVIDSTCQKTMAASVASMVKTDLAGNCHLADTDSFVNAILPLPMECVDSIYEKMKVDEIYTSASWKGLLTNATGNKDKPKEKTKENAKEKTKEAALYAPFVNIANRIVESCATSVQVKTYWLDRHSMSPRSRDKDAASIRPDIVSVLGTGEGLDDWENNIASLKESIAEQAETDKDESKDIKQKKPANSGGEKLKQNDKKQNKPTESGPESSKDIKEKKKELAKLLDVWWLRVHVPIKIKTKNDDKEILDAVKQLCGYLRQILREQLDRRFALGLTFCGTDLSIWLCDRSGLLGTATPINIHREPKKFIQIMASLSLLTPERLGWDPTMKLYLPLRNPCFIHSYDPSIRIEDYLATAYRTCWAFEMPSHDGKTREVFISIRALSLRRAEVMCGRGTLVWHVTKFGDETKHYVLKQCWRPQEAMSEGGFYDIAEKGSRNIARIYSSEEVKVGGSVDDTLISIRRGVAHIPLSLDPAVRPGGKRPRDDEETEGILHMRTTGDEIKQFVAGTAARPPNARVLTRLLMETYGWPIKFFSSLSELLRVMRDAIQGHKYLYYKGILHRDVSTGNILISSNSVNAHDTTGCLIDLDYAKNTTDLKDREPFIVDMDGQDKKLRSYCVGLSAMVEALHEPGIDYTAAAELISRVGEMALSYVKLILATNSSLKGIERPLNKDDLGLLSQETKYPNFFDRLAQPADRTGTLPFISYEVLTGRVYAPAQRKLVIHESIHDMESFMWVLIYLCLTRKGPGGIRRDELAFGTTLDGSTTRLHTIVYSFFDTEERSVLAGNKSMLFQDPDDMEEWIIPQFHPYFQNLKPLVSDWWKILYRSYLFSEFTTIHDQFLAAIDKMIEGLPPQDPDAIGMARELERRRADLNQSLHSGTGIGAPSSNNVVPWVSPDKVTTGASSYRDGKVIVNREAPSSPTPRQKKSRKLPPEGHN